MERFIFCFIVIILTLFPRSAIAQEVTLEGLTANSFSINGISIGNVVKDINKHTIQINGQEYGVFYNRQFNYLSYRGMCEKGVDYDSNVQPLYSSFVGNKELEMELLSALTLKPMAYRLVAINSPIVVSMLLDGNDRVIGLSGQKYYKNIQHQALYSKVIAKYGEPNNEVKEFGGASYVYGQNSVKGFSGSFHHDMSFMVKRYNSHYLGHLRFDTNTLESLSTKIEKITSPEEMIVSVFSEKDKAVVRVTVLSDIDVLVKTLLNQVKSCVNKTKAAIESTSKKLEKLQNDISL